MNVYEKRNAMLGVEFDRYVRDHPSLAINPIAFARAVNEQFLRYQLTALPLADETQGASHLVLARWAHKNQSRGRVMGDDPGDSGRGPARVPLGVPSCWDGRGLLPANPTGVP